MPGHGQRRSFKVPLMPTSLQLLHEFSLCRLSSLMEILLYIIFSDYRIVLLRQPSSFGNLIEYFVQRNVLMVLNVDVESFAMGSCAPAPSILFQCDLKTSLSDKASGYVVCFFHRLPKILAFNCHINVPAEPNFSYCNIVFNPRIDNLKSKCHILNFICK